MHSIYAIVSAKKKTTSAHLLRDLMSSAKKKNVVQKCTLASCTEKISFPIQKKLSCHKGLNL
jgi:hypothetical protein